MMSNINKKQGLWTNLAFIEQVKQSLNQGHASITSTDTILGLIAPTTEKGFQELNTIKGGRSSKPYLVVIGSPDKLGKFVQIENISQQLSQLLHQCWPGPVTIIFRAQPQLPNFLKSEQGTIALRCPEHQGLLSLLTSYDALFSTSANKSGQPFPKTIDEVDNDILEKIDYIVLNEKESNTEALPSTILDASLVNEQTGCSTIKVIREGAYPLKDLERFYGLQFEQ